jgi:hypothetical protein
MKDSVAGKGYKRDQALFVTLCLSPFRSSPSSYWAMPLAPAMASIEAAFAFFRYSTKEILTTLREGISMNVMLMVVGIMVFKGMLDATGAIEALPVFFRQSGLPTGLIFFILPFIVGLLTGLTVAFVGTTFPIIMAMMGGSPDLGVITFAFASGFAGVMLLLPLPALTIRYFNAIWRHVLADVPAGVPGVHFGLLRLWCKEQMPRKRAFPACL